MTQNPSTHEEKVRSFWDRYVQSLHESGIQPPFDRWMVIRAEHDIAAYPDRKLAEQSPEDVDAYLAVLGRKPGLKDWQFRQAVDAIQNLLRLASVNWLDRVDWDHWRASARGLASIRQAHERKRGRIYLLLSPRENKSVLFFFASPFSFNADIRTGRARACRTSSVPNRDCLLASNTMS
ncbi:hypothetical protein [Thiobaca trueperi]|uniref:Uncharacterized protein n=1 Tax=Thiobaca trueperi TaxID=127458 RepID=A0A4R3N1W2_9GAMM|nr:hypothetical protein [Thiobaca trueperi]TCT22217.1 hypothetical protein EDC35_103316 [Thiobaca trueperi]